MGKRLGGPKGSVGNLAFCASLALNLMQHRYKSDLFVVGGQGRLFVERALSVFIPADTLTAATASRHHLQIKDKIKLLENGHHTMEDLTQGEKPDVIKNVFIVARVLLNKVMQHADMYGGYGGTANVGVTEEDDEEDDEEW